MKITCIATVAMPLEQVAEFLFKMNPKTFAELFPFISDIKHVKGDPLVIAVGDIVTWKLKSDNKYLRVTSEVIEYVPGERQQTRRSVDSFYKDIATISIRPDHGKTEITFSIDMRLNPFLIILEPLIAPILRTKLVESYNRFLKHLDNDFSAKDQTIKATLLGFPVLPRSVILVIIGLLTFAACLMLPPGFSNFLILASIICAIMIILKKLITKKTRA